MFVDPKNYWPEINDQGVKDLYKLAEIVLNCHFLYVAPQERDDLTSAAILKAITFIRTANFDPSRSSLKNVLYTAMRNEMKNTIYRNSKDFPVDDEILVGVNEAPKPFIDDIDGYIISDSDLSSLFMCSSTEKRMIKETLQWMGFTVDDNVDTKYHKEVEKWVTLIVWKKLRYV